MGGFRLACIWFGFGPRVRGLFVALGGGKIIEGHTLLFEGAAGRMLWSDAHLWQGVSILPWLIDVTPESVKQSATFMAKIWFVIWLLLAVAIFGFTYTLTKQRLAFWKRWKEEGMRDIALNFTDTSEDPEPKRRSSLPFMAAMSFR